MNKQKSFTLIELLVVIAIIGLLSAIVLVSTRGLRQSAKTTKGLEFHQSIQNAMGAYVVGWWSFEEIQGGTTVLDSSGYDNHGTVNGATLVVGLEDLGNALNFDGNDYVSVPSFSVNTSPFRITMEAWLNPSIIGVTNTYFGGHKNYYMRAGQGPSGRHIGFGIHDGSTWNDGWWGKTSLTSGIWYHVVGTYDGNVMSIYVNGSLDGSNVVGEITPSGVSLDLVIGSWHGSQFFNGLIDEVRIYEHALSAGEIQQHYAEGLTRHKDLAIR